MRRKKIRVRRQKREGYNQNTKSQNSFINKINPDGYETVAVFTNPETNKKDEVEVERFSIENTYSHCADAALKRLYIVMMFPFGTMNYSPLEFGVIETAQRINNDSMMYWQFGIKPIQLKLKPLSVL